MIECQKLHDLKMCIHKLNGVEIPYNIIQDYIKPLLDYINMRLIEIDSEGV